MIHSPAFQFDNDIPWQDLGNGIKDKCLVMTTG